MRISVWELGGCRPEKRRLKDMDTVDWQAKKDIEGGLEGC